MNRRQYELFITVNHSHQINNCYYYSISGSYVVDDDEDRKTGVAAGQPGNIRRSADAEEICRGIEALCNYHPIGYSNV